MTRASRPPLLLALLPCLSLFVACDSLPFEPAGPEAAPDPSAFGPYPVGVRTLVLVDENRPDADGTYPRRLTTEIWYPAVESARDAQGAVYDIREVLTDEQRAQVAHLEIPLLETAAVRDAEPRNEKEGFPLVVFSHGMSGIRWQSTFYTVTLASHGYIVVAPDHPGHTLHNGVRNTLDSIGKQITSRPEDVSFLLDELLRRHSAPFLKGLIQKEKVGVSGHSFGGITSLRVASLDDRVKAIVPQTPGYTSLMLSLEQEADFKLGIPTLVQGAKMDTVLPWADHVPETWTKLDGPRIFFDLVRGGHYTYSDLCRFDLKRVVGEIDLEMDQVAEVIDNGCGEGMVPASVSLPLINHFAVGFFNGWLRESPGSLELLTQKDADARASGEAEVQVFAAETP